MTKPPAPRQRLPLPDFNPPATVKMAEAAIYNLSRRMDENAYALGRHLIWLKAERRKQRLPGKWEPYVEGVFGFSRRKGRYLMAHARECEKKGRLLPYEPGAAPVAGDEFYSPESIIVPARAVVGEFDLDPASCAMANERPDPERPGETIGVKARTYYSLKEGKNGLDRTLPWKGRVWMNPPYTDNAEDFCNRLKRSHRVTEAVLLLSTRHVAQPWFDWLWWEGLVCFPLRHLEFTGADGKPRYTKEGNVIVYIGRNRKRFEKAFSTGSETGEAIGHVVESNVLMAPKNVGVREIIGITPARAWKAMRDPAHIARIKKALAARARRSSR